MVRLLSILLSCFILFQSLNIHITDVLELDELVEHYQFHAETYGDNFLVFLSKHYGELKTEHHNQHQEEQEEHEELPFQNPCTAISPLVFMQHMVSQCSFQYEVSMKKEDVFHYIVTYTSPWGDGLFQPPRHT